jgi:diguanylate cyclase (GGDEF)-like protein
MGAISLVLPHPAAYDEVGLWSNVVVALLASGTLLVGSRMLPAWAIQIFVLVGILVITRAVLLSHGANGYYPIWYVWVGLYSFFFFGRRFGIISIVAVGLTYGYALTQLPIESDTLARWLMILTTVCVGGLMVDLLAGRLRRLAEGYAAVAGERAARTDELTGLANRRAWEEELIREVARAGREQTPLCIAVLDLDRFKAFNDRFGHQAGDRYLKSVSAIWQTRLRSTDVLARYGGEEFALALPGCDIDDATDLVERLCASLPEGQSCSGGVAQWNGEERPATLVGRADRALYEAKEAGRDRIMVA